jgi:hypothetical protein
MLHAPVECVLGILRRTKHPQEQASVPRCRKHAALLRPVDLVNPQRLPQRRWHLLQRPGNLSSGPSLDGILRPHTRTNAHPPMCRLSTTVGWLSGFPSCLVFVSVGCCRRLAARCVLSRFRVDFLLRFAVVRRPLFSSVVSVGPLVCCMFPVAVGRLSVGSFLGLPAPFWVFPAALFFGSLSPLPRFCATCCLACLWFPRPVRFVSAPALSCSCCPPGLWAAVLGVPLSLLLLAGLLSCSVPWVGVGCRHCGFGVWVVWWVLFLVSLLALGLRPALCDPPPGRKKKPSAPTRVSSESAPRTQGRARTTRTGLGRPPPATLPAASAGAMSPSPA